MQLGYGVVLATLGVGLSACGGHGWLAADAEPMDDQKVLPVKRVVLFQNGVAYVERQGRFRGDELRLRVKPDQIQDILKSIIVVDLEGGRASSLALPVDVGSERALAELPKLALGQGGLAAIMGAVRGAEVRIEARSGTSSGRLVGLDDGGGKEEGQRVSVLEPSGTIRIFPVAEVRALRILDPTLFDGLVKGLDIALGEDAWRAVDLRIFLDKNDGAQRELRVSYLIEMPTWKSSYRLVLDAEGEPLLQGWGIVDNVSGQDWRDVELTMTTGSPVSFNYNLYTPRFVERPDLTPYRTFGIAPPVAVSAAGPADELQPTMSAPSPARKTSVPQMKAKKRQAPGRSRISAYKDEDALRAEESGLLGALQAEDYSSERLFDSMKVQARSEKVGSLYRFTLDMPVTVPNRSSTMIALINQKVPGQAIYLYNPNSGVDAARKHPFRAVRLKNATSSVLEPGPMAIVRNGQFSGEGLIERIERDHETYIAYALDTAINVTTGQSSGTEDARLVRISRGVVETRAFAVQRSRFEVQASAADGEALPLVVGLPKRSGWEVLVEGGKLASETADQRYFSVAVKPGEKVELVVKERQPQGVSYRIDEDAAQQALVLYLEGDAARPELIEKLQPVVKMVNRLADIRTEISHLESKRDDLQQRAGEVRENLKLLRRSRNAKLKQEIQQRLLKLDRDLSGVTDQLVKLRDEQAELTVQLRSAGEKLELTF